MKTACFFAVAALYVAGCLAADADGKNLFDYHPLTDWGGVCVSGKRQSPINIDADDTTPAPKAAGKVEFKTMGTVSDFTVFFTGFSLEIAFKKFSKKTDVRIPANEYTKGKSKKVKEGDLLKVTPLQMHFHTVSEHTIDGFYAPAELHIVTKVDDGESDHCDKNGPCLAVFGIMMTYSGEGDEADEALATLFGEVPSGVGQENGFSPKGPLNLDDFLPESMNYYTYLGSLTTPPCSEVVTWHVFTDPVAISAEMVDDHQKMVAFTPGDDCTFSYFGVCTPPREKTNHRNVQPYNGRTIYSVEA